MMDIVSRLFGGKKSDAPAAGQLVANPKIERPLCLQVLFADVFKFDLAAAEKAFRSYHRSMAKAKVELLAEPAESGNVAGLVGWQKHVIRIIGFPAPMPADPLERCVAPSHYPPEVKAQARAHQSHLLLYYSGYDTDPLEQYVSLAAAAGVFARLGAIIVVNESAQTSLPAVVLKGEEVEGDLIELLRALPLAMLYCGFVKHEVDGVSGVWMRTYGANRLGLPDLAAHARSHDEGQRFFDIFENIFSYLRESEAKLAPGHTMQIEEDEYLRFREARDDEPFLDAGSDLLVVEIISAKEINSSRRR